MTFFALVEFTFLFDAEFKLLLIFSVTTAVPDLPEDGFVPTDLVKEFPFFIELFRMPFPCMSLCVKTIVFVADPVFKTLVWRWLGFYTIRFWESC